MSASFKTFSGLFIALLIILVLAPTAYAGTDCGTIGSISKSGADTIVEVGVSLNCGSGSGATVYLNAKQGGRLTVDSDSIYVNKGETKTIALTLAQGSYTLELKDYQLNVADTKEITVANAYCGNSFCETGETCTADSCCAGVSKSLQTDTGNCGSCGNKCSAGQTCSAGACVTSTVCGNYNCETGETCTSCSKDCGKCDGESCSWGSQCDNDYCVHGKCRSTSTYCGDSSCDYPENCETCQSDCACTGTQTCASGGTCKTSDGNYCSWGGECAGAYCVHNKCAQANYAADDGYCDTWNGETCSTSANDCACTSMQECKDGQCKTSDGNYCSGAWECAGDNCVHNKCSHQAFIAGDGQCDSYSGENCASSPQDCGCKLGTVCEPESKSCVSCFKDEHCPGQRCYVKEQACVDCIENTDCATGMCDTEKRKCVDCLTDTHCKNRIEWSGAYVCSADHRTVLETGVEKSGTCDTYEKKCKYPDAGSKITGDGVQGRYQACGDRFCQEKEDSATKALSASCGCAEGYSACVSLGQCTKDGALRANQPCSCDSQCESGYCDSKGKVCLDALSVTLSSTKQVLGVGEETTVTVSVNNNLEDREINADIVLNVGTGAVMTAVISGDDCSGNQCKISRKLPARAREDVTIRLTGESSSNLELSAGVNYAVLGKTYAMPERKKTVVQVIQCGNGKCEAGESQTNCCDDCGCQASTSFTEFSCQKKKNEEARSCVRAVNPSLFQNIAILIFLAVIIGSAIKYSYQYNRAREESMEEKEGRQVREQKESRAKEEHEAREKRRILASLDKIERYVDVRNPPSEEKLRKMIKDRLGVELDEDLFEDEYLEFLDKLEERRKDLEREKAEKSKLRPAGREGREEKGEAGYCGECGARANKGDTYCGECGAKL